MLVLPVADLMAQERLTLQDAIARTLKHNYDINIADLATEQAARNNTYGNAGFAPDVFFNASTSVTRSNVYNELANGAVQSNPKAASNNLNPGLVVNWTIFDGGRMFVVKKRLDKVQALTEVQLRVQMQTMVSRTVQMYAQVVWRQKQIAAADTALHLAQVRMAIANLKYETGAGAKVDYLQARVDYNMRRFDSLTFESNLKFAADSLAVLMGEQEDKSYKVDDSLVLNTGLPRREDGSVRADNLSLAAFKYSAEVSHLDATIANTYFLPTLSLNGGYNYSRTNTATGFALYSRSYGPNAQILLSMPVFRGGNIRRQSKVASLQAMRDDLLYERQNSIIGRQYRTARRNYEVAVTAYLLEQENIKYAKENLDVQLARFRLGVGTTLESRQAENDYVTSLQNLYTAAYNLKVNETLVLELENKLVN